ncbi:AlkA N-terminal domain-containing protein [Streptomyces capparidis]
MPDTFTARYQVISSRDPRFDGAFYTAVKTTGIYCRPSCPARTPKPENVVFYTTAAAAQKSGFRACRRCRPEASPGSPEWNTRADLVGRALRLIAEGVVDEAGVGGLARRLAVGERHLHRLMAAEVGVGPLTLARTRRAQTARLLLEATGLPVTDVAFASGYASVRQFNDSMREAFGRTPTELRRGARGGVAGAAGDIELRLAHRRPWTAGPALAALRSGALPGLEEFDGAAYRRSLRLPRGSGVAALTPHPDQGHVTVRLRLTDLRDLTPAVQRCRRLFDLDADPCAVDEALAADPLLAPLVRARPGLRMPGHVDGFEAAVRVLLAQDAPAAAARDRAARLVADLGTPLAEPEGAVTHLFPTAGDIAAAAPDALAASAGPHAAALHALAGAVAGGTLALDPGADRAETAHWLRELPGVGPCAASHIALRALGDPDALPATDPALRRALRSLGAADDPASVTARAERWRPWGGYAAAHLWARAEQA